MARQCIDNAIPFAQRKRMTDPRARNEAHFRRHWWGYGLSMLILYAFSGPLIRYIPADNLHLMGLIVAGIVFCGYWASIYWGDWDAKVMLAIAVVLLPLVGIIGTSTVTHGIQDGRANDRRCLAIQGDMLSAQPRRADGPDLFQALGCRPQGEGSVYAPKRRNQINK